MLLRVIPAIAIVTILLAGCVSPAADQLTTATTTVPGGPLVPPKPDFDFSKVVDPDHGDHLLPQLHTAGHGLELQGLAPIQSILPPGTRGSITQIDMWENYALVSGMEGGLAFAIVDIKDPAKPKAVSYFPSAADGWTARFSADGEYVFYGCQMLGATGYTPTNLIGTCKDPNEVHAPNANPGGIIAVDVKDKAKPKFVDFLVTSASHNLFVASINGTDTIFTNGVNILQFDREAGKLMEVTTVPGVHDSTVHQHPITKDWLLFTGTKELAIYNVNDPKSPSIVFEGDGKRTNWTGWHEQTMIPGIVDGRVILVLAGETGVSPTAGAPDIVTFVDITDPTHPAKLSTWKPPFDPKVPWFSYYFSAHEMAATPTGQVAISWYHGGVWVVDVSTKERQSAPVTLAAYQPHDTITAVPSTFAQTPIPVVPFVWGAGWDERGYLVVPDMHTGVYVLKPDWGLHPTGTPMGGQ
ncbi:MAG: hypothetical protein WDA16_13300 [Candidatus Thermoplasmatota archaeon]